MTQINYLHNSIILCSSFLSIQWFILMLYKLVSIKQTKKDKDSGHLVIFKFSYVLLMITMIIFMIIALFNWHKYHLLFSVIEGILIVLIAFGIVIFFIFNHIITTKSSHFNCDDYYCIHICKISAMIVSLFILLLDVIPYLI